MQGEHEGVAEDDADDLFGAGLPLQACDVNRRQVGGGETGDDPDGDEQPAGDREAERAPASHGRPGVAIPAAKVARVSRIPATEDVSLALIRDSSAAGR